MNVDKIKDFKRFGAIDFLNEKAVDKPFDFCFGFVDKNAGWYLPLFFPTEKEIYSFWRYLRKESKELADSLDISVLHKVNARAIYIYIYYSIGLELRGEK